MSTPSAFPASRPDELFSASLIPSSFSSTLPEGYTIRPLRRADYEAGVLDVLRVLTSVGDISAERWRERFDFMKAREGDYYVLVILEPRADAKSSNSSSSNSGGGDGDDAVGSGSGAEGRIVGTGALVVERKFIHNLGSVGHIEDIAVSKDQQGKKLGLRIIQALDGVAERVGCYKTILDCSEANEGFYVKCGYKRAGLEMAHYYEKR